MNNICKAFYINLEKRTDRRSEFEEECRRMNINVERFPAIEDARGCVGCFKSHLFLLELAKAQELENVLIFEDDFQFIVSKEEFESQLQAFFDLNIPYDILMLGYNANKLEPYNETISCVREAQTTSGYLVHSRFFDKLIHKWKEHLEPLIITDEHWIHAVDQCWNELQGEAQRFCFNKRIGIQRAGYSDIANSYVNYGI